MHTKLNNFKVYEKKNGNKSGLIAGKCILKYKNNLINHKCMFNEIGGCNLCQFLNTKKVNELKMNNLLFM